MLSDVTTPQDLDENLRSHLAALSAPAAEGRDPSLPIRDGTALTGELARQIFEAQLTSRHLDLAARWLHSFDAGFCTVSSSGHEGNAAVAVAVRANDPVLLHYRSGAFYCARAAMTVGGDPIRDVLRGLTASVKDPVSGGRHRGFGNPALHAIPTVGGPGASHLPRALGIAYALGRGRPFQTVGEVADWPPDAVVLCSFGDASANRSAATAAFNAAGWLDRAGTRLPALFICEDNSIPTAGSGAGNGNGPVARGADPAGWVADSQRFRPGLRYFTADGCDAVATYEAASRAGAWVRKHRRPAVLHLSMVRLLAPAGAVRRSEGATAAMTRDPVVATARTLVEVGLATPEELLARYDEVGWLVRRIAEDVLAEPRLESVSDVIASIAPRHPAKVAREVAAMGTRLDTEATSEATTGESDRVKTFGGTLPEQAGPLSLGQTINATLTDALLAYPELVVFGENVTGAAREARFSDGTVTNGLRERFGAIRVFDTVPDETSVIGLGLGSGLAGMLPVPEIRRLSRWHEAVGQLRTEAAITQFLSLGAYRNPMVLRVPGLPSLTRDGAGVADDNTLAALRDVPGLVVAVPARAEDAPCLLRTCLAAARVDGTVCVFVEPVALYDVVDLHTEGDGWWCSAYAAPADWGGLHVPIGRARVYPEGTGSDLTILTFGNGVRMSLRAARQLAAEGVGTRVVDLRWLSPLPVADIVRESSATGRVLVVDETRRSGGVGEGILAVLVDAGYVGAARRVAGVDSFVPLGPVAENILIAEDQILRAARTLLAR
jgi:2-oxoisovalerate dehydrogenase E1 component